MGIFPRLTQGSHPGEEPSLRRKLAHLLRRAGLSASQAEIERYLPLGIEGTVEALLDYEKEADPINDEAILTFLQGDNPRLNPPHVVGWWIYRMLVTRRPLQERMALFWHNHFATSSSKVNRAELMLHQIQLFQRLAIANFQDLVLEVSRDAAMLVWLDGVTNVKGKPNENYARELLELFTMGIGNYTEQDIKEAARAFTGWSIRRQTGTFLFRADQHDDGEKRFLGQRGNFDGTDIVRIAVQHPATARHLSRKFCHWFLYENPEPKVVDALAKTFTDSGYEVRALLRRLFLSETFYSEKAYRKIIKSPVDFVIGTFRNLGIGEHLRELGFETEEGRRFTTAFLRLTGNLLRRMGQALLFPPSVKGWDGGTAWISSATMIERIRFADLLTGALRGRRQGGGTRQRPLLLAALLQRLRETSYSNLEEYLNWWQTTLDVELSPDTKQKVLAYLQAKGGLDALNEPEFLKELFKLIFSSPEYQFI